MLLLFFQSLGILLLISGGIIGCAIFLYKTVIYIEDHTMAFKSKLKDIIIFISLFHIILLLRGVNIFQLIYSVSIQFIFYNLYLKYPYFVISDPLLILGSIMALINHFLILRLLVFDYYILEIITYFILCVWFTPFCFYVSLSANDELMTDLHKNKKVRTIIGNMIERVIGNVRNLRNKNN